jgi:HAD superfamily hydrolase (TIGR01549 family)
MGNDFVRVRCIIFDFDGTLVGGLSVWIPALVKTLSHYGVEASPDRLKDDIQTLPLDGTLWRRMLERWCPGNEDDALLLFHESLGETQVNMRPSMELVSFLRDLRVKGVKTAIVTYRTRESTERELARMKIGPLFDLVVGLGDTEEAKPSPLPYITVCEKLGVNPEDCLVVGDEPSDIFGASQANMVSVGVLTGFSDRGRLEKFGADHIIQSVEDLKDLLSPGLR